MSKHAPGPFELIKHRVSDDKGYDIMYRPDENTWDYKGEAVQKEDAILWAAAPDMLEALRKVCTCRANVNSDVMALVDTVIAKAKGEA